MRVYESLAAVGMVVAAVDVAHTVVRHLNAGDNLPKLEQKTHRLAALVADGIVWVLDQHRIAADVGDAGCIEIVAVDIRSKNLRQNPGKVIQDYYRRPDLQGLFPKAGLHLRGLVACVEKPGIIQKNDPVEAEVPRQTLYAPL